MYMLARSADGKLTRVVLHREAKYFIHLLNTVIKL